MAEKQETVTDLIAWLRSPTEGENAYLTMWRDEIANRLEAAYKRERGDRAKLREALKRIVAASIVAKNANAPEWILQRMADIFAMATTALAEPPRNCDAHTTDPDWKDICAKCKDGDILPEHCEYSGEPNGCNSPIYGEHPTTEKSLVVGNAAKLREALLALKELDFNKEEDCYDFCRIIDAALAAPPRNCDVGTAKEQSARFDMFCYDRRSYEKGCGGCPLIGEPCCEFTWAQMPYEEGGAK